MRRNPNIARWNLARLAETLLPLFADDEGQAIELATEVIESFMTRYQHHWLTGLRAKLGLKRQIDNAEHVDTALGESWLDLLHAQQVDFTLGWRRLADALEGDETPLRDLFAGQPGLDRWLERWRARCTAEDDNAGASTRRAEAMRRANPWLIPRNHHVEEALTAASDEGDLAPFEKLLKALQRPYDEAPGQAGYAEPASDAFMAEFRTFCGT
jgi:uncharacterized protein YdiU (UPF0061 family)